MNSRFSNYILSLFVSFSHLLFLSPTSAGTVVTLDEEHELQGLIPDFFLDHSGFKIEGESPFSILGADAAIDPVPLFPLFEKGIFRNSFIGIKIPAEYFSGMPEKEISQRNGFSFSTVPMNYKQSLIAQEVSKIKLEDNIRLIPYFVGGALYAIRSDTDVEMGNQTTVGISIGFSRNRTVKIGSDLVIGGALSLGGSKAFIDKPQGINVLSQFQRILDLPSEIQNFEDQKKFYQQTIKFAPYIRHYLNKNAEGLVVPNSDLRGIRLGNTFNNIEPKIIKLNLNPSKENLSREWRKVMSDLRDPVVLAKEIKWREEVKGAVENQLVLANDSANRFLQDLCDHMSAAYQVPIELYPRCRIAASLAPNAWAYPGGDIFVSVGLIGILSDLDSLRLVIGHEIAHVLARHTTRAQPGRMAFMYAAAGASLAAQAALTPYALSGGRGLLGDVTWLTWIPQSTALAIAGGVITNIGMELLFLGPYAALMAHQRSFEWQADRLGHEAALATGARPEKLGQGWIEFRDFILKYLDPEGKRTNSLLASHPNPQDRFESIESKGPQLYENLKEYQANRLPEAFYHDYSELHQQFRGSTIAWGENALRKLKQGDNRASNYSLNSLFSPAGKCVIHSLSGEGLINQ